ncbi:MAG: PHP domain-containing protein, partial [Verrucomicrobiaceae bacterium]
MPIFAGEFHARSAFSFLHGASLPEEMVRQAGVLGYEVIAITDHLGFYGSARAHKTTDQLRDENGIEITARVGTSLDLSGGAVPVICATQQGYRTLSQSLTDHHLGDPRDRLFTGLIALTGDREGPLYKALIGKDKAAALSRVQGLIQLFGHGNVYVEINRHGLRDEGKLNRQIIDLAAHLKLPLLACNAPLHATPGGRELADAFTCLRHHTTLDQAGRLLALNKERHLKERTDMDRLFADLPEALLNTRRLKDRLGYTLRDLGYQFPNYWENGRPLGRDEQIRLLREKSHAGARAKPDRSKALLKQIDHEIELIGKWDFAGYFLIVHEIMEFARGRGILCQGRGSAANSAVCYALEITYVNPVEQKLLFERFLSGEKGEWPDIDIDFPSGEQRETVIQHVFGKYGPRQAAMTANVI